MLRRRRRVIDERPVEREEYVDEHLDTVAEERSEVQHTRGSWWSPAQLVALVIGLGYLVIGAIALARAGTTGLYTHTEVAGIHQTQLLAFIHIVFGVLMTAAGAVRGAARGLMTLLGAIALAFGVILLVQPESLHGTLGTHQEHGFLYLITGALCVLAGVLSPDVMGSTRVSHRDRRF